MLGHKIINKVIHSNSSKLHKEQTIAINPSKPYSHYKYYIKHNKNQCTNMHFFGNAIYFPHINSDFTHYKMVKTSQYIPYPAKANKKIIAFAKPLAIAIHAAHQASKLQSKQIFISNIKPISCLIVNAIKTLEAAKIVYANISPHSLSLNKKIEANMLINPQNNNIDH